MDRTDADVWVMQEGVSNMHMASSSLPRGLQGKVRVDRWTATLFLDHQGTRYYFCSQRCLERFRDDPQRYLAKGSPGEAT